MPKISGQRPHNEVGTLHIIVRKSAGNCQDIVHGANFRTMTGQRWIHIDMCTYTIEGIYEAHPENEKYLLSGLLFRQATLGQKGILLSCLS